MKIKSETREIICSEFEQWKVSLGNTRVYTQLCQTFIIHKGVKSDGGYVYENTFSSQK